MGGHAAGEVASAVALSVVKGLEGGAARPEDVRARIVEANTEILAAAGENPDLGGMGTTVTGVCRTDFAGEPHWVVFNVGDSRVYRFADGQLAQLTTDHNELAELVASGDVTPEEAVGHPLGNVLTRALGIAPCPEPDLLVFPPTPGERFLLCSDGLTLEVHDTEIAEILATRDDPAEAAQALVDRAVEAGGRDNVTAVVLDVD
jgi:protein phosphatase